MVGRNKKFTGHSEWMNEFNKVHNSDYYYGKKKTKTKKTARKPNTTLYYPVFKVSDRVV